MKRRAKQHGRKALVALSVVVGLFGQAMAATLRIATYNIDDDTGGATNTGPHTDMAKLGTILQAIGNHHLSGNSQPIDVLSLQELHYNNPSVSSSLPLIVNALNNIYGAGTYAYDTLVGTTTGNSTGNGPNAIIYNTNTVEDIAATGLTVQADGTTPLVSGSAASRQPTRYLLRPKGYASNANFYLYSSHYKASSGPTNADRRTIEAQAIRANADALGPSAHVIYSGDFNFTGGSTEAAYQALRAAGNGQANDPLNATTPWTVKVATESSDSLTIRFDFQLVTSAMLNQPGVQINAASYEAFGNNGSLTSGQSLSSASNTALSDLANRTTVLGYMADQTVTDHLPVVADYFTSAGINPATIWKGGVGNWSVPGNWRLGVVPNSASVHVLNDDGNATTSVVSLDQNASVGDLTTDAPDTLTINATRTLTLSGPANSVFGGPLNNAGTLAINAGTARLLGGGADSGLFAVAGGATLEFGGGAHSLSGSAGISGAGAVAVTAGVVTFVGASTYTGSTTLSAGKLLLASNLTTSSAVVVTGGTLESGAGAGGTRVIKTPSVSVSGAGRIDLQDNKLITQSPVGTWSGGNYSGISGLIRSGRNGGAWTGPGIVTSQSSATRGNLTTLGVASAEQVKGIAPTATSTWAGQTVTGSDTLVMYTYGGDANLDGKINVDDYTRIDFNVPLAVAGWYNGDFNYDGKINVDDYTIIDFNVGIQGAPFSTGAASGFAEVVAVPEPGGAMLVLAAGLMAGRRRRRRQRQCD